MAPSTGWRGSVALLVIAACAVCSCREPEPGPPHVVLIIADTLRADVLGSYGARYGASPELDALASRGAIFERVIAPSSWTRPSTGALLTGQLPRRLGLYRERGEMLPNDAVTLAESLQQRGYRTLGASANPSLNRVFNFAQGFDSYRDSRAVFTSFMPQGKAQASYARDGLTPARGIFEDLLTLLGNPDPDDLRAVYLQANVMEAHEYARGERTLTRAEFRELFPEQPSPLREYLQSVRQLSVDIAELVGRLRERPGWDNALFAITSDHGEGLGDHPGIPGGDLHGTLLYESQVRVPWIVLHPSLEPGVRVAHSVRLLDVMPTLLGLLGLPTPPGIDGHSLAKLLVEPGAKVELPEFIVTETYFREPLDKQAVYTEKWAYFQHKDRHPGTRPHELHRAGTVARDGTSSAWQQQRPVAERLQRYLQAWNRAHPRRPSTPLERELSREEEAELRAIGYLE